jgi:hypothetical protein
MRIVSLNMPFEVIEKVAEKKMESGAGYRATGSELLDNGRVRALRMAGGSASRWKSSLEVLIKEGLVDGSQVPDNLPRALAAVWSSKPEQGYTGPQLMFNSLARMAKGSMAYVLSPYTWQDFMQDAWANIDKYGKQVGINVIAQNSSEAMVMENGQLTASWWPGRCWATGTCAAGSLGSLKA